MKKTVKDIDVAGKTVLVRVDYNVPIDNGVVGDTLRIEASFPTIRYLLEQKCKVVLISHLGRPEGKCDEKFSLRPVAKKVGELLGQEVKFGTDCVGVEAEAAISSLQPGEIVLLENLRFHAQEEANDAEFAQKLASLGEVYVNDAFAVIHRAHASTLGVAKFLQSVAGLLVDREVSTIMAALEEPARPLISVVGGAKIADKIEVLNHLITKVDGLLIGGAMANTFLAAQGKQIGKSLYEANQIETAKQIMATARQKGIQLWLPVDAVVSDHLAPDAVGVAKDLSEITAEDIILDVGPATVAQAKVEPAGTYIWNGPLGVTEIPAFAVGSRQLADLIIGSGAFSLVGGGDTAAFIDGAGMHEKFSYVSTGGGASLDLMAGKKLPGYEALLDK